MSKTGRSSCPINLTLEVLGDRWTLLILRDIVFADRRYFREILRGSNERITSSILADRLDRLVDAGILTRTDDATHKQKAIYSLTQSGVDLVPVLATIGSWGKRHCPADPELTAAVAELDYETPASWAGLMDRLRVNHVKTRST